MSAATDTHPFWGRDPLVLVVNLDDRPQRWQETMEGAASHLPIGRLTRHSAVRGVDLPDFGKAPWFRGRARDRTWAGRAGCLLSHRRAIARAAEEQREWLLVLEDDVAFEAHFDETLRALAPLLDRRSAWAACYLGFTDPVAPFETLASLPGEHALRRIGGANTTHAYLLHRRAFAPLLSALPDETSVWPWLARHRAIDRWYRRHLGDFGDVLAASPSLVNQRAGLSDITGRDAAPPEAEIHATAVGPDSILPSVGRATRALAVSASDAWDAFRARRKRLRGF